MLLVALLQANITPPGSPVYRSLLNILRVYTKAFWHMGVIPARIGKGRCSLSSHVMMNERSVGQPKIKRCRQILCEHYHAGCCICFNELCERSNNKCQEKQKQLVYNTGPEWSSAGNAFGYFNRKVDLVHVKQANSQAHTHAFPSNIMLWQIKHVQNNADAIKRKFIDGSKGIGG